MSEPSPDTLAVRPFDAPPDASVVLPGSKSLTNRALVCAALARGESQLHGALFADDTEAMLDGLAALGVRCVADRERSVVTVTGGRGRPPAQGALVDARLSGTTSRFLLPVAALASGTIVVDGAPPLRARPMADLIDALGALGARLGALGEPGHLPVQVDASGLAGGSVTVRGDVSSQFLSALLLSGPAMDRGLEVVVDGPLVSQPYVDMTVAVMQRFGAEVVREGAVLRVAPSDYRADPDHHIEPDASAASYFFAAAAVLGGRVRVEGLGSSSLQGDLAFVDVLEQMGAEVRRGPDATEVRGTGHLRGVSVDLGELSDTAQTLAAVAVFADSPTTIEGIGFIRAKETDRIGSVVAELRRCGIRAEERADGMRIHPGTPTPASVRTYDDHRMAMSFALLGLRVPGIVIEDPGCVAKTFPGFWRALEALRP